MVAEKNHLDIVEKQDAVEKEYGSSGISSPAEFDELPDPDAGKSDEERAKLVRPCPLFAHR